MKKIDISVLVAAYNAAATVEASIRSLLNQKCENFEIVVVEDGSKDETSAILHALAAKDERLVVINNSLNQGLTRSLNIGLARCRGDFIARHDADDFSHSGRLSAQLHFARRKQADFVVSHFEKGGRIFPNCRRDKVDKWTLRFGNFLCHGTFFFSRNEIQRLGGYREEFRVAQDYELLLRYVCNRGPIPIQPEALYTFTENANGITAKRGGAQRDSIIRASSIHLNSTIGIRLPRVLQSIMRNL